MVVGAEFVRYVLLTACLTCKVCNGFWALSKENLALDFCGGTMLAMPLD